jgi:Rrf2 family protein
MYVSARLDYGLRALAALASRGEEPLTVVGLAERQGVSESYIGSILTELRHKGLVVSSRGGHRAGYRLARPAADICVGDVLVALSIWPVDGHDSTTPIDDVGQRLAALWQRLGDVTNDLLASVSLADLAADSARRLTEGPAPVAAS